METQLILIVMLCVIGQLVGIVAGNRFFDWWCKRLSNKGKNNDN